MRRRNYQPSISDDSTSSVSVDNEEEESATPNSGDAGENADQAVQDGEGDVDSESNGTTQNTLLFPFLKDHGLESTPLCRYFNLTLGASMSREGNEGHAKTIQVSYRCFAYINIISFL